MWPPLSTTTTRTFGKRARLWFLSLSLLPLSCLLSVVKAPGTTVVLYDKSGFVSYPNSRYNNSTEFTIIAARHSDRVIVYVYELEPKACVRIGNESITAGPDPTKQERVIISAADSVTIRFECYNTARVTLFYRAVNIGDFSADDLRSLCDRREGGCQYERRSVPVDGPGGAPSNVQTSVRHIVLTFPTKFHGYPRNEVRHCLRLRNDTTTMALVDLDPERVKMVGEDSLRLYRCSCSSSSSGRNSNNNNDHRNNDENKNSSNTNHTELLADNNVRDLTESDTKVFEINALTHIERRTFRFYNEDICVSYKGTDELSTSEWVLPTQLVELAIRNDSGHHMSFSRTIEKRLQPGVELILWPEDQEIIKETSKFSCEISMIAISSYLGSLKDTETLMSGIAPLDAYRSFIARST